VSPFTRISPFLISFAVTSLFFINLCDWIFQCGCRSLWAGADIACNIHAAHGHHCPWCSHGHWGHALIMTMICAPQLAVAMLTKWSWPMRTIVALGMFPAIGLLVALGFGWADSYWTP
jgi:hypothetical protein